MSDEGWKQGRLAITDDADAATDQAIEWVKLGAPGDWMERAQAAVVRVALAADPFTTDDVWAKLEEGDRNLLEPRAMGAVMRAGARASIIEATPLWVKSERVECHHRPIRVWKVTMDYLHQYESR